MKDNKVLCVVFCIFLFVAGFWIGAQMNINPKVYVHDQITIGGPEYDTYSFSLDRQDRVVINYTNFSGYLIIKNAQRK